MFNKTKPTQPLAKPQPVTPPLDEPAAMAPSPVPLAARPKPVTPMAAKPQSSIGSGLLIDGNILGNGDLLLDGTVRGDVKVAHLIVGESGNIEGKVEAETIEVRGRVVGAIQGRQVRLLASAYVEGDITHDQLSIDVGAFFQGRCQQNRQNVTPSTSAPAIAVTETTPSAPVTAVAEPAAAPAPASADVPSLEAYDLNALSDLK